LTKAVDREVIGARPYELDAIWRSYVSEFYYGLASAFFVRNTKTAFVAGGIGDLILAEKVDFIFGRGGKYVHRGSFGYCGKLYAPRRCGLGAGRSGIGLM
jgi:hypothetical protein